MRLQKAGRGASVYKCKSVIRNWRNKSCWYLLYECSCRMSSGIKLRSWWKRKPYFSIYCHFLNYSDGLWLWARRSREICSTSVSPRLWIMRGKFRKEEYAWCLFVLVFRVLLSYKSKFQVEKYDIIKDVKMWLSMLETLRVYIPLRESYETSEV